MPAGVPVVVADAGQHGLPVGAGGRQGTVGVDGRVMEGVLGAAVDVQPPVDARGPHLVLEREALLRRNEGVLRAHADEDLSGDGGRVLGPNGRQARVDPDEGLEVDAGAREFQCDRAARSIARLPERLRSARSFKGIRESNVTAVMGHDGTVTLSGTGLPADEAEAACVRVQDLAAAAKRAGHPGLIGQIRCDLFLGLLDGRFHNMTATQVLTTLIAQYHPDGPDGRAPQ